MVECVVKSKLSSEVALFRLIVSSFTTCRKRAHLRIANTLQELNLLIQLITLFNKPRFSKEPSYSSAQVTNQQNRHTLTSEDLG
jgi:hypothetical protein